VTEPRTASEPSGQELVIVGMAGRRNGPPLSMRYDDDDDDDDDDVHSMAVSAEQKQQTSGLVTRAGEFLAAETTFVTF